MSRQSQPPKRNITLIGMPGAGKSTLGVVLAKMLNMQFLDADLFIQTIHGKTLQQLIDEFGAEGFIAIENEALQNIDAENTVIATGGSAIYSPDAIERLAATGLVVYLEISYDELVTRLGDLDERGVVMTREINTLRELYDERRPLYERAATVTVNVNALTITEAAHKVVKAIST